METLKPILSCNPGATDLNRPASRTLACKADLRHRQSQPICSTGHATRISPAPLVVSGLARNTRWLRECAVTCSIEASVIGSLPESNAVPAPAVDLYSGSHDDRHGDGTENFSYRVRYYT
jgi:hypothetical protein